MGIPDDVIEAMAKSMWDIYANSEQANEAWRGLSWETLKANVGKNRASDFYVKLAHDEIRAALAAAEAKGWKLVPREPSERMIDAGAATKQMREVVGMIGLAAVHGYYMGGLQAGPQDCALAHAYRAMISAAPSVKP